jgi:putative Holliday junction resolvase
MGVDLGEARIGVALSDPLGITAQPLEVIVHRGSRKDLQRVEALAREHAAHTVVVGLPLLLSGEDGEAATAAREFAQKLGLRLRGVRVELWDERLTTVQAERAMIAGNVRREKRKRRVDVMAAALILQSWLDSQPGAGALP